MELLAVGYLASQVRQLVDCGLDGVPLALAVPFVDVGAGMADDVHAGLEGDLEALEPADQGGAKAMEALPGLLAPPGHGMAGVDAGLLDDVHEEGAWAFVAP